MGASAVHIPVMGSAPSTARFVEPLVVQEVEASESSAAVPILGRSLIETSPVPFAPEE